MRCAGCGCESPDAARFCMECGAPLGVSSAANSPEPVTVGEGRYRVERVVGEGARKIVYAGSDERLGREVAIAVIKTDGLDDAARRRIDREARAMARLGDHPNIVTVFDVGDDDGRPYIVSELMPGGSVADLLAEREHHRLSVEEALRIGEEVARALTHAHAHGVVHRDLKPANLWIAADGTARLGDFGLAVEVDRSRITSEGMVVGTVAYLAPEQAVGRAPDARSDLYALGASLYETLTGRPPFLGDDAVTVISQHLNTAPVAPSWHNPAVTAPVELLVLRLLEKDPAARIPDAATVVEELRRLRADRAAEPEPPAPAPPGGPRRGGAWGRFVGRASELATLTALFDESLSGKSQVAMVVGEPGIGKTRLVEEFAVHAAVRGAQVCWGHCYEGELGAPYQPFVEALRSYVRSRSDDQLRAELSTGAPEVATLVSELRARFPDLPSSPPLDGDAERLRLFNGVASFLVNASADAPIVLLLDDVHWADKPSLLLLQYLARNVRRDRVLIVCTYRDVELDRAHPLAEVVASLRREHLYERVLLRGLDRDEVKAYIEAVGEQDAPEVLTETIHRETEGNPFFVGEILRNLAESGALKRVDGAWVGSTDIFEELPEGVREVVGRRLSRLGDDCNRMLTIGAAMPGGFTPEITARVLDLDDDRVLDLLDDALAAQIVRERREPRGVYEFSHALIRQTLYSELSTPRRVRMHRQILAALEDLYATNPDPHLAELAYHAFQAAPGGDVHKAVDYATRAGRRASAAAAHEEAARAYDLALQALELDDAPDDRARAELLLALGSAHRNVGDETAARNALDAVAELSRRLDDPELLAQAALTLARLRYSTEVNASTELLEEVAAQRERLSDASRARVLARLGSALAWIDLPRHRALAEEAVAAARRSGDPNALAHALGSHNMATRFVNVGVQQHRYAEVARLADASGDLDLRFAAHNSAAIAALAVGDRSTYDSELGAEETIAEECRSPFMRFVVCSSHTVTAVMEGRYADAEALISESLVLARLTEDQVNVRVVGATWFPLLRELGRSHELEGPTRRIVERQPRIEAWRAGLAQTLADQGKLDEAAEHIEYLAPDEFAAVADNANRAYVLGALGEVVAQLHDTALAAIIARRLESSRGAAALIGGAAYHGATDRYLGLLATTLGRQDDAIADHEAALAMHERMNARPWVARSKYDLAGALIARAEPGDVPRALGLLNEALDTATALGQKKLVEEVLTAKLALQGIASGSMPLASIDAVTASLSIERPDLRSHAGTDGGMTVLFSDIEGYTPLNERLGDARTQELLRTHDHLIRDCVANHAGTVVKSQGDGYMIVFARPDAALAYAIAIQRAIHAHNFGGDAGRIRDRIGVHAGEVIREGDDFFGRTVIIAARIATQASGGEILASDDVRRALHDPSNCDVSFGASREIELKGLSGTHRVHRIDW